MSDLEAEWRIERDHGDYGWPRPSFRQAAPKMGVSHATIMNNINLLEKCFGEPVVNRETMGGTRMGFEIMIWADYVLKLYDEGMANIKAGKQYNGEADENITEPLFLLRLPGETPAPPPAPAPKSPPAPPPVSFTFSSDSPPQESPNPNKKKPLH